MGVAIEVELDFPDGVEVCGYERHGEGHAFEVRWRWPETVACEKCGHEQAANIRLKETVYLVRDLDIAGQPSFFAYVPPYHTCASCGHRQHLIPPFRRKDVTYTYRFEREVLRLLIGSNEEEVARRLGISAETVALIAQKQLEELRTVDPEREITDIGLDEISLKKRHKLYATVMTDLSDPKHPRVLAVTAGRDQDAATAALQTLTPAQREQVRTHRADMSAVYPAVCAELLPNSQLVIDRFHVAKRLGEVVDGIRKKRLAPTSGRCRRPSGASFAARCGGFAASRSRARNSRRN